MEVKGKSFYDVWKKMLKLVLSKGKDFQDGDRICKEFLGVTSIIEEGNDPLSIIERLNEFEVWVYPNEEEIKNIVFSKNMGAHQFSLGSRIFNFNGVVNQIDDFVIPSLKENSFTRRAIISLWNPKEDSIVMKKTVPSMMVFDFKLREGKLDVFMTIRSDDAFFGFPTDAYITYLLQEYICKKLNVKRGKVYIFSTSVHIFDDQIPYIKRILEEQ